MLNTIPLHAMNDFLLIINSYGSFLKQREIVKTFGLNEELSTNFNRKLNDMEFDVYSWSYREFGNVDGITTEQSKELKSMFSDSYVIKKEEMTQSLISTEKYYKKLKHEFVEKYPESKNAMTATLKEHQEYLQNHKRARYQLHQELLSMSPRFISFFSRASGCSDGCKIAYHSFFSLIEKKYNLIYNLKDFHLLADKIELHHNLILKLTENEINFIANILKQYIENIQPVDLTSGERYVNNIENGNISVAEKIATAENIISKMHNKDKKLLEDYLVIQEKLSKLL